MAQYNLLDKLCWDVPAQLCWDIYMQFSKPFGLECMEMEIAIDWCTKIIAGSASCHDWDRNYLTVETQALVDLADMFCQQTDGSKQ